MTANIEPTTVTNNPDTKKKSGILRYFLMPDIVPQAKELGRGGFGFLAYLIAYVYQGVRILPASHPYTNINNLGTFGLRDVVIAAANNVVFSKKNIDQILIFFAVLFGIAIMALQFISFIILMISGEAFAGGAAIPAGGLFDTQFPDEDIAFSMMREVFGIPNMFGALPNGVSAFHTALHGLFALYNMALLIVAVLVFLYYVIVVVAETAQTGTPFGQRFSHIYAPLRLVIAIGLLVPLPLAYGSNEPGFNGAQYITLYAAKLGSGFASTGWIAFNDSIATNPLGAEEVTLISPIGTPSVEGLVEFMAVAVACAEAYTTIDSTKTIEGRIIYTQPSGTVQQMPFSNQGFGTLSQRNNSKDIVIQFGSDDNSNPAEWTPYCGEITVPVNVPMGQGQLIPGGGMAFSAGEQGYLQWVYFNLVRQLWIDTDLRTWGLNAARAFYVREDANPMGTSYLPDVSAQDVKHSTYRQSLDATITSHYAQAAAVADYNFNVETRMRGWGGAGIWYNRIARINGAYTVATMNAPSLSKFPMVMEEVLEDRKNTDGSFPACEAYDPNLANNQTVNISTRNLTYARIMNDAYQYWTCDNADKSRNILIDAASTIFGLEGLVSIRETVTDSNGNVVQIHPLAKLSALGKGLVESAVRNMGMAAAASGLGGALSALGYQAGGQGFMAASSMFVSLGVIGLSIGFITFYILPFLPFIYFFFAVGGWVKGIFEAMVGAPLWALAHLRIDGDGIPGKMALNGYFLIFEIFIRPILTVFGLIGGMAIFSAMAIILNEIFDLVVSNASGVQLQPIHTADARSTIDVFFFTIVYAIILYMMALASFKMINLVPNSIIRWLGQNISAFNDNAGDPAGNLTSYAAIGGNQIGSKLAGGLTQGTQAIGSAGGAAARSMGLGVQPPA